MLENNRSLQKLEIWLLNEENHTLDKFHIIELLSQCMPSRCGGTVARAQVDTCSLSSSRYVQSYWCRELECGIWGYKNAWKLREQIQKRESHRRDSKICKVSRVLTGAWSGHVRNETPRVWEKTIAIRLRNRTEMSAAATAEFEIQISTS